MTERSPEISISITLKTLKPITHTNMKKSTKQAPSRKPMSKAPLLPKTKPKSIFDDPRYTEPFPFGTTTLSALDLLGNIIAFGSPGSGKSRSFLLPLTSRMLRHFGSDQQTKTGLLLIDAKGDMEKLGQQAVKLAKREQDLYILGENGNAWFPLFEHFGGNPVAVANFLFEVLEHSTADSKSSEVFWLESSRRLLRSAAILAQARHGWNFGAMKGICQAISDILMLNTRGRSSNTSNASDIMKGIQEDLRIALLAGRITSQAEKSLIDYIQQDVEPLARDTWSCIATMGRNYVKYFSDPHLNQIFEESAGKVRVGAEEIIDEGKILLVCLSPAIYGATADPFRAAIKKVFYERVLQRDHLVTETPKGLLRPINQERLVLCVMDEFHTILSPKGASSEPYFLDRNREFRCFCILAAQDVASVQSVLKDSSLTDHLLNCCRTKFFGQSSCPQTRSYFKRLTGDDETTPTGSLHYEKVPAPALFRLPNHKFVSYPKMSVRGKTTGLPRQETGPQKDLGKLKFAEALIVNRENAVIHWESTEAEDYFI